MSGTVAARRRARALRVARLHMISTLNSDPNWVVMHFFLNASVCNITALYNGDYDLYRTRLAPFINKEEFEKHMAAINKTFVDNRVGFWEAFCCGLWGMCTLFTSLCYISWKARRWIEEVDKLLKNEINPAIKHRNIAFVLRREFGVPYLAVHILVPIEKPVQQVQLVVVQADQPPPKYSVEIEAAPPVQSMYTTASAPADYDFCPKCGTYRTDKSGSFCGKCGNTFA